MDRGLVLSAPVVGDPSAAGLYGARVGYSAHSFSRHGSTYCGHVHSSLRRAEQCRRRIAHGCNHSEVHALWTTNDGMLWREVVDAQECKDA